MAERSRRARPRQISEVTEDFSEQSASESELDWDPRKLDSARRAGKNESPLPPAASRVKRGIADDRQQSIRLTMKVAPSKLREVTRANEVDSLQDTLGGGKVIDGPRSRRSAAATARSSVRAAARPRYAEYGESDLEDETEGKLEDDDDQNDEAEAEEEEVTVNDFAKVGAEAEGGTDEEEDEEDDEDDDEEEEEEEGDEEEEEEDEEDDDEDVEMEDAPLPPPVRKQPSQPKPPKITLKPPPAAESKRGAKGKIIVTPAQVGPLKSVEDQEMEDDPDDDEVDEDSSELSEDEDVTNLDEEDAEGEEEILGDEDVEIGEEGLNGEDMEDDSGDETPASGAATPDPNRLTKRQRGRPEDQTQLMALDMAPQQRKFFTDEEKAMKKDEHARKRKELTKRKIIEEKTAALNRLLKPQANKARGAAPKPETLAAAAAAAANEEYEMVEKAHPLYSRWVSTKDGIRLGVPDEWLERRRGQVFNPSFPPSNGALIQEVE